MLRPCPECGNPCAEDAVACPKCGKPLALRSGAGLRREISPWYAFAGVMATLLFLGLWFFGSYHVVSSREGTQVVQKVHWTLAETFVSLDAITGQPAITAKARYPLAVKALQREGLLESDSERERRLQEEFDRDMERTRKQIMREVGQ